MHAQQFLKDYHFVVRTPVKQTTNGFILSCIYKHFFTAFQLEVVKNAPMGTVCLAMVYKMVRSNIMSISIRDSYLFMKKLE